MSGTKFDRGVVKKGSSVVMARFLDDVEFQASDMTTFNYLLLRAYDDIEPNAIHQVPIKDVMEYSRFDRIGRVHEAIQRLCRGRIEIDYKEPNGEDRAVFAHFLSGDISKSESGFLKFAFDPILVHFLIEPKVFSLVSVNRSRDLKSLASFRLYEAMSLQFHKKTPVWRITIQELRDFLGIGDSHARFDNFKTKVIERAIGDVNAVAEFDVLVDYIKGGQGGAVIEVEFKAVSKSHSKLIQARSVMAAGTKMRRSVDRHTVDILDGMTNEERGGPAEIMPETLDKVRPLLGENEDLGVLVSEWREHVRGGTLVDPDRHFEAWIGMRQKKESDPLLKDIDGDVFGALLGGTE